MQKVQTSRAKSANLSKITGQEQGLEQGPNTDGTGEIAAPNIAIIMPAIAKGAMQKTRRGFPPGLHKISRLHFLA